MDNVVDLGENIKFTPKERGYILTINEVVVVRNEYFVRAKSPQEALAFAKEGKHDGPELLDLEYRLPTPDDKLGFEYAVIEETDE